MRDTANPLIKLQAKRLKLLKKLNKNERKIVDIGISQPLFSPLVRIDPLDSQFVRLFNLSGGVCPTTGKREPIVTVRLQRLLSHEFGLGSTKACTTLNALMSMRVMPSTVVCQIASRLANGDAGKTRALLASRPTFGTRQLMFDVGNVLSVPTYFVSSLWKSGANADAMWLMLYDYLDRLDSCLPTEATTIPLNTSLEPLQAGVNLG